MSKHAEAPLIPPPPSGERDRVARAARRMAELKECQDKVSAVLDEYDATFAVTELASFPNGVRTVRHSIDVISR